MYSCCTEETEDHLDRVSELAPSVTLNAGLNKRHYFPGLLKIRKGISIGEVVPPPRFLDSGAYMVPYSVI